MLDNRRWGPFRQEYYSICSRHKHRDKECKACAAGEWRNRLVHRMDNIIYSNCRILWRWWHNRPNSRIRRFLETHFPNLKSKE